ncbi:hypothetical protein BDF21DRAFT_350954 [Thamnidium elegans]|nr:hypothetical protein BDF21DRAFT_350954 [Thamnidium elegans]
MTEKEQSTSSSQVTHQHGRHGANLLTDHSTDHHHHSRLLYFLTDPSILSLSRLTYPQPPFLFPTPSLINTRSKLKSKSNLATLLPNSSQPIAVAAVDDCCNKCFVGNHPTGPETERQEETRCKWSSCVAKFNTMEDLTPHLYKTHLNNRKAQQSNACFWESCAEGALLDGTSQDLLNHLTSQHLKRALLHACRWLDCTERFEAFDKLTIHLSKVHVGSGKSEYSCQWVPCQRNGKIFTQRQKIMRHIQTHTGAKPFQCQICQKHFSESNIMTQHMRTHTGEKPYKCDQCDRQFSVSASLTIHKRVHSGEKPFACKYQDCNKRFSESSNLTKHVSIFIFLFYLYDLFKCVFSR